MFHIRKSMEEVQSMCQKVELSGKIKVSYHYQSKNDIDFCTIKSFLPLWMRVHQCSIEVSIMVGGFLLMSHLMKQR